MTVDKNSFASILHRYAGTSPEEAQAIVSLKENYPFSQLLQTLAARVTKDHGLDNHQQMLEMAAIHAADRVVLKEVITSQPEQGRSIRVSDLTPADVIVERPEVNMTSPDDKISAIQSIDKIDYADEIMRDLTKLNSSRHNFEMLFVEYSEVTSAQPHVPPVEKKIKTPEPDPSTSSQEHVSNESVPAKGKSKKERIKELAKSLAVQAGEKRTETRRMGNKKLNSDSLIQEIQSSKKEITPENEKQKEQIEIIDEFIRIQPSISNSKDRIVPLTGDLNPIKSGEFGDNIVSETLVEILIKQGKKDKAIEVLKKLIWKYPQKKSYFASQIEDLKK